MASKVLVIDWRSPSTRDVPVNTDHVPDDSACDRPVSMATGTDDFTGGEMTMNVLSLRWTAALGSEVVAHISDRFCHLASCLDVE